MSEAKHDRHLSMLEASLAELKPAAGRLDTHSVVYLAGRQSAWRAVRFWRLTATSMAAVATLALLAPWIWHWSGPLRKPGELARRPSQGTPDLSLLQGSPGEAQAWLLPQDESDGRFGIHRYLRLRQTMLSGQYDPSGPFWSPSADAARPAGASVMKVGDLARLIEHPSTR